MKWLESKHKRKALFVEPFAKELNNAEILRISLIAELDAISLYEEFAELTTDNDLKTILLDIAKEEKTHVGELKTLLEAIDKEQAMEFEEGYKEVKEKT